MARSGNKDFRFGIDSSSVGLNLNRLLIAHPSSTFFMRLENDAKHLELNAQDILQVDRSLTPKANDIVAAVESGEPDIKVLRWQDRSKQQECWGVVVNVIRNVKS